MCGSTGLVDLASGPLDQVEDDDGERDQEPDEDHVRDREGQGQDLGTLPTRRQIERRKERAHEADGEPDPEDPVLHPCGHPTDHTPHWHLLNAPPVFSSGLGLTNYTTGGWTVNPGPGSVRGRSAQSLHAGPNSTFRWAESAVWAQQGLGVLTGISKQRLPPWGHDFLPLHAWRRPPEGRLPGPRAPRSSGPPSEGSATALAALGRQLPTCGWASSVWPSWAPPSGSPSGGPVLRSRWPASTSTRPPTPGPRAGPDRPR